MMTRLAQTALLLGSLLLAACNSQGASARFTGLYTDSFETQAFTPEGGKETWWVMFEPEAQTAIAAVKQKNPESPPFGFRLLVEFEGRLSAPGYYGHLGAYPRELIVTRVISAKQETKQ